MLLTGKVDDLLSRMPYFHEELRGDVGPRNPAQQNLHLMDGILLKLRLEFKRRNLSHHVVRRVFNLLDDMQQLNFCCIKLGELLCGGNGSLPIVGKVERNENVLDRARRNKAFLLPYSPDRDAGV